ncbi:MAG: hypothetical protein WCE79_00115 [Xanthobacteraceae bacterium]
MAGLLPAIHVFMKEKKTWMPGMKPSMTNEIRMPKSLSGLRKGLTSYSDLGFSLFCARPSSKAKGFSDDELDRPISFPTATLPTGK